MKDRLIELFKIRHHWTLQELQTELALNGAEDFISLIRALNELEEERLIFNDHSKYVWIDDDKYFIGKLKDFSKYQYICSNGVKKLFLEKRNAKGAFDKDDVLLKLGKKKGIRVIHVYNHGIEKIVGEFVKAKDGLRFRSDIDLHRGFKVVNFNEFDVKPGDKAVVEIVKYSDPLQIKILRLIGPAEAKGVDITALLVQNGVRMDSNPKIEAEVKLVPEKVSESEAEDRVDFRNLKTITIDGDTSKDFDDAISLEKTDFGYRLYVHIADVAHYVKEGSAIDKEAYARGTSVYVADRVVPMLPFELSNGICSLNPDVDRLTMTAIIDIDKNGKMIDSKVVDSIIHSDHRCTYNKVNEFLEGNNPAVNEEYKDIDALLHDLEDLTHILQKSTEERGSIDFNTKEPTFIFDETGKPIDIFVKDRGYAEQMIEECMIRANIAVAHATNSCNLPGIYRVHAEPDPEKLTQLANAARALKVPVTFNANEATPADIQAFLHGLPEGKEKDILQLVALRAMQKAAYSGKCLGHFGLALPEYAHFTSPIRRYPDLIMHRMLKKYIVHPTDKKDLEKDKIKIEEQAVHTSQKEKDAVAAERAVDNYEMARYMEDKIGQQFQAEISGVTNFGFFAELPNSIEGLVPVRKLDGFYKFDENTLSLIGDEMNFSIGDPITVKVSEVDVPKGLITFDFVKKGE